MSTRRPKSVLDQERYTAELSTGQLVIGVCILLMFGLGCFLFGVLIGKFDPTLKPTGPGNIAQSQDDSTKPEVKVAEMTVTPASPPPADASTQSTLPPEMRVPPRIINEPQSQPAPAPATTETNTQTAAPPSVDVTAPASAPTPAKNETSVASTVEAAAEKNRAAPPNAPPKPVDTPSAPAPTASSTPAVAEKPAVQETPWKGYGVQVVAVAKDRADAAKKTLESKSSYKARVLPHSKSNLFRVVVGPYADQVSAMRARDELRARFGYKDAFVLTL